MTRGRDKRGGKGINMICAWGGEGPSDGPCSSRPHLASPVPTNKGCAPPSSQKSRDFDRQSGARGNWQRVCCGGNDMSGTPAQCSGKTRALKLRGHALPSVDPAPRSNRYLPPGRRGEILWLARRTISMPAGEAENIGVKTYGDI